MQKRITEVFDPTNSEHLSAFKIYHKLGKRTGILADPTIRFTVGWQLNLIIQIIEFIIGLLKKKDNTELPK